MTGRVWYALAHATCGHACGLFPDRAQADRLRQALAAGGYHRWRVRLVPAGDLETVVTGLVESQPRDRGCGTCRVDVERATALFQAGSS